MSDIKNLHRAYAAVYDSEIKENLKQSRDEISAMSLTQMNDVDLYEVAEEVLEEVGSNIEILELDMDNKEQLNTVLFKLVKDLKNQNYEIIQNVLNANALFTLTRVIGKNF